MARPRQLKLAVPNTWGGRRKGAGRKPGPGRPRVPHLARPVHKGRHPVHITMRTVSGLPSLRRPDLFVVVRDAIARASSEHFRILHFSVQADHLHLIVEADDRQHLLSGARGLSVRTAHAINRALSRKGQLWGDRYHIHQLTTPREVRNAIVYVLMNVKKHHPRDTQAIDPCSSAPYFDGFRDLRPPPSHAPPIRHPRTWLAAAGWRRHGLISPTEHPRLPT